ncbi:MAG TPA: HlyD family efflux transporter periplasmic adaptor subunit [Candidatus Polarisedimenticolaceae bacterium]
MARATFRSPILASALALLAPACSGSRADRTSDPVGDLEVHRGPFVETVLLTGALEAERSADLGVPRIPGGTSIRWLEADGARVKAGQKVVEFDGASFGRDLEEKKVQRRQAESDLEQRIAEVAARNADKAFAVEQRRLALEKAKSEAEVPAELLAARQWQERQLALERAKVEYAKALEDEKASAQAGEEDIEQRRINLQKAAREIAVAETALSEMTLVAPTDGILVHADHMWEGRKLQVGDTVWMGVTVVRIPDLAAMRVQAQLSDVDDGRIAPGMRVRCVLDTYPELEFPGKIVEVQAVAREAERFSPRRMFPTVVTLDRTDPERMRPGMSVRVEVEAARREGALLAPRAGLDLAADPVVARLRGGERRPVKLGPCNASVCIVEEGLEEGRVLEATP